MSAINYLQVNNSASSRVDALVGDVFMELEKALPFMQHIGLLQLDVIGGHFKHIVVTYQENSTSKRRVLRLPAEVLRNVMTCFVQFQGQYQPEELLTQWNKMRLAIFLSGQDKRYHCTFKNDPDLAWLEADSDRCHVKSDVQKEIQTWEGLSEEFPRFWLNQIRVLKRALPFEGQIKHPRV